MNRRRFLLLAAGSAAGLAAAGGAYRSLTRQAVRRGPIVTRKTFALGTEVSITALHPSPTAAARAIATAFDELALVEELLSIYRPDSELSLLNCHGRLAHPHPYLLDVLQHAQRVSQQSGGAFDVTVQPLWDAFAAAAKNQQLPNAGVIAQAKSNVDWTQLEIEKNRIRLLKPSMKVTLNGIAQGFATDRVLAALRAGGVEHALINAGELLPLGRSARGDCWRVGIQHPRQNNAHIALADLDGRALATSGDYATRFSADGRHNHILDPRTGGSPTELSSVSILAPTGMAADALSTACFVLGPERSLALLQTIPAVDAFFVLKDGETIATSGFPLRTEGSPA
jgi:thiamine biosynthesis lipoprotein